MGDGALMCRSDLLGVFPQISRGDFVRVRLPCARALLQFAFRQLDVQRAFLGVDFDHVAVVQQPDGPAQRCFWPDVTDTKPRVAPEKRPSVMRATLSPIPCP